MARSSHLYLHSPGQGGSRGTTVAALIAAGRHAEAVEAGRRALAELDALAERFPDAGEPRRRRMGVYDELANAYQALDRLADEVATRELAVRARTALVEAEPDHLPQRSRLGGALNNLARALHDSGDSDRAVELLHEAVRHQRIAFEHDPENPQYRLFLRNHLWGLAETSLGCGDAADAASAACELATLDPPAVGTEHRRAVWLLARCVATARDDSAENGAAKEADAWTAAAVELLATALERGASSLADLEQATDLEPLHAHPAFAALLEATRAAGARR